MSYWKKYGWRWVMLAGVIAFGLNSSGSAGMVWALIAFGLFLFVAYAVKDAAGALRRFFKPGPQTINTVNNFTVTVETDAIKGTPHRDPTRPTVEDHLAMLEGFAYRKEIEP
jgi:hypothetical protein